MTRYETLKHKPKQFLSLTGYTLEEFSALLPSFFKCFLEFVEHRHLRVNVERSVGTLSIKIVAYRPVKINCSLFWFTFVKL